MPLFLTKSSDIIAHFEHELKNIRTGRVTAAILDSVLVEAYGTHMHIKELATITIPEPSQLLITPFDKSIIQAIEKALIHASIGASPVNDGAGIRLSFPPLTEENRKNRAKEVDKLLELSRVSVRQHRQDVMHNLKKQENEGSISEDDRMRAEQELQKEVDQLNKKLESLADTKKAELMKL